MTVVSLALGALLFAASLGGCPAGQDGGGILDGGTGGLADTPASEPDGDGPVTDNSDPYGPPYDPSAGGTGSGGDLGSDDDIENMRVGDAAVSTLQDQPVSFTLPRPALPEVAATSVKAAVAMSIVSPPANGELGDPQYAPDSVTYTYYPDPGFVGRSQFSYRARFQGNVSNVATVEIRVLAPVQFAVSPGSGQRNLTVTVVAEAADGGLLPEGTYTWKFDDEEDSGPVSTHGKRTHTFRRGGMHTVSLTVLLAGLPNSLICTDVRGNVESHVTVAPIIVGTVRDVLGDPLANVDITSDDPSVQGKTNAEGRYTLTVPYGWSGEVRPERADYEFEPAARNYNDVNDDTTAADYDESDGGDDNQPPTASTQHVETNEEQAATVTLSGSDPDDDPLSYVVVTVPAHGTLKDQFSGHVIVMGDLPYTLASNLNRVVYTPAADFYGADAFTFRVFDGLTSSNTAAVTFAITNVNDAPRMDQSCPRTFVVEENSSFSDESNQVGMSATDPDPVAELAWSITEAPTHGAARFVSDRSGSGEVVVLEYEPQSGYVGADQLVVNVADGLGGSSDCTLNVAVGGYLIGGTIRGYDNSAYVGAVVVGTGSGGSQGVNVTTTSKPDGTYALLVPVGWSGTVSTNENYRFEPASRSFSDMADNAPSEDWVAYRNFYVATNGNDAQAGYIGSPFAKIQRATSSAQPGDTIYLRGGDYQEWKIVFANSGQPGKPISVVGYPGETARVTSTAEAWPVFDFTDVWDGGHQKGYGHYVFRNLKIHDSRHAWLTHFTFESDDPADLPAEQAKAIHDILIEDCEVWGCQSAFKARYAGVYNLTVRRTHVHGSIATEGGWDFGEWPDDTLAINTPRSASHDLLFEDCDSYDNNYNQQCNGWVFQPCVYNVTMLRCRAWNNGKYGFACKGSGNFKLDRCAAWGNNSTQMYCRGFASDESGTPRTPFWNSFRLTNCVFIAPGDQRGGAALNWRQNCTIEAYNCTIVGLRNEAYHETGGYTVLLANEHELPGTWMKMRNCIVVGYTDAQAVRFAVGGEFIPNLRYEAGTNLFYAEHLRKFIYQTNLWSELSEWQAYWAVGEPGGDDGPNGPRGTLADATSIFGDPRFLGMDAVQTPVSKTWSSNFLDPSNHADVRVAPDSPAVGLGENLTSLGVPELAVDYFGNPRAPSGNWTAGAFNP